MNGIEAEPGLPVSCGTVRGSRAAVGLIGQLTDGVIGTEWGLG